MFTDILSWVSQSVKLPQETKAKAWDQEHRTRTMESFTLQKEIVLKWEGNKHLVANMSQYQAHTWMRNNNLGNANTVQN